MYRTKLYWPGIYETEATLTITFDSQINYSDQAFTFGGVTSLVDPVTMTFDSFGDTLKIKGKYIALDDVVYFVSGDAVSESGGTYAKVPAQKVTFAPWTLISDAGQKNAIQSSTITWSSNSAENLTMGSVCTAKLECKIIATGEGFGIDTDSQFQAYKVAEDGTETQIGVFNVETPTRLTANTYKIVAYDNVRKLDKDLSEWFNALDGWPYKAKALADMIAGQCGVAVSVFNTSDDYEVYPFTVKEGTTGRQLMSWLTEATCNYCIAAADGTLVCKWYDGKSYKMKNGKLELESSGPKIGPSSKKYDLFYYQGSLSHEDFDAADIDGFRIVESDSAKNQVAAGSSGKNYYYIVGNPVIMNHPNYLDGAVYDLESEELTEYGSWLIGMQQKFSYQKTFTPFSLKMPENMDAQIGTPVTVTDSGGKTVESYITDLVWTGNRMEVSCTGNRTRENATAASNLSNKQLMDYSDQTAKKAASAATANLAIYKSCSDCSAATTPGFYYLSGSDCVNNPARIASSGYGVLLVEKRFGNIYQTVKYNGYVARRYSIRDENDVNTVASWSEWEYENPPMVPGTEYRTTKRYNGKAIYTKAVEFGALPNATAKTVSCGAVGANVVSWQAVILSGTNNAGIFPWYDSSGNLLAMAYINSSGSIYVKTFSDQSAATAKFIIEYVKE